eukprot:7640316-Ditylum_brightwellii.AAC.1
MSRNGKTTVATKVAIVVASIALLLLVHEFIYLTMWKNQAKEESQFNLIMVSAQVENYIEMNLGIGRNTKESWNRKANSKSHNDCNNNNGVEEK